MKDAAAALFARIANLFVANFTVTFQNELRFMSEMTGSVAAQAMRADNVPVQTIVRHASTALSRL
ncbi:hypothetical protein H257_04515 [Aphanomyces astaci]|uniref:Uncharacterized protein n=1 Tax=Aphanomyces astaci TaxID=112090 RepID=W4GYC7_APHAT|nr:hypothetical protein H257_04515 [Aphanomyces astaci]ETV83928.1 hypothetical protein H257_04515 [Aphanomyces astaci]|eukprot:XP_009827358.1 hypothetical protein H257_04515 [Aphanomyces astaci]